MPEESVQPDETPHIPQLTATESGLIYDEMLRTGRIIQVASGGVRVFDRSGIFIRDEVLKAKSVFPRIDITPGLERLLEGLMEDDDLKVSKVRSDLYRSVYQPIKRNLDELVHDSRIFFGDSSTIVQVRADVRKVIERLDLLTLGMLNNILNHSELGFRRHVEAGVYSGLAGSVVFGEYKRKLSDKKVVEDLIMLGIVHGLGPDLKKSKSFQELYRTSKSFYDVEKVLDEASTNPDEPTNVLSEILATSLKYIIALDATENRDPLDGLVTIMSTCTERHAVGVGALAHKYTINEYMINYLVRDEAFHERLRASEDRFEATIRARMAVDSSPATIKLGEMFLRQIRFKRTVKLGSDAMHRLDEFIGVLLPVKVAVEALVGRMAEMSRPEYAPLARVTQNVIDTIDVCLEFHEQHADPANWPELENVPGGGYLIAYKQRANIEYHVQHVIRVLDRCRQKAAELLGSSQEAVVQSAFSEVEQQMMAVDPFRVTMELQPVDVTHVLRAAGRLFKGLQGLSLVVTIPDTPATATVDPIGLDEMLYDLLESMAGAACSEAKGSVSLTVEVGEHRCFVAITSPSGALPGNAVSLLEQFEAVAPGAVFRVNVTKESGATCALEFPIVEQQHGADASTALQPAHS